MNARSFAAIGLVAIACQADYVHVVVESASTELVGLEWEIAVRAYGGGNSVSTSYDGTFEGDGPVYTTDFNLVIDDAPPALDLRVAVPGTPGWAADRVITPPGDGRTLHILLYTGERYIATTRPGDGDVVSVTRFGSGIAMGWLGTDGVALRIERVPDSPTARALLLVADTGARKLRIASPPTTDVFGPDLLVVSWLGGDGAARYCIQGLSDSVPRPVVALRRGDDVWSAAAPEGSPFTIATAIVADGDLWLAWHDGSGHQLGESRVAVGGGLRAIRGFVVGAGGAMLVATENVAGKYAILRRVAGADSGPSVTIDGAIAAIALSGDQSRLFTAQRAGSLEVVTYQADTLMEGIHHPVVAADRVADRFFGAVAIGSCAVAWPELRDDGSMPPRIDVRVRDLDDAGAPTRASRLAHGEVDGDHLAPSLACMSSSLVYSTFLVLVSPRTTGDLMLRKVPASPALEGEEP